MSDLIYNELKNCCTEFQNMLLSNDYINTRKYEEFLDKYEDVIEYFGKNNMNIDDDTKRKIISIINDGYLIIDKRNKKYVEKKLIEHKDYFDNMFKDIDSNIVLDEEQRRAIIIDEDYSLIIAGAGSGKTTTMTAKVKYLVDIKRINPARIAVMSFTKKATQELEKRIVTDFGIDANVTTFHSLGLMYTKEMFKDRKYYIVDENTKNKIFLQYFKDNVFPYKQRIKEIMALFKDAVPGNTGLFGKHFRENYDKYDTFDEYFEEYKNNKIQECKDIEEFINRKEEKLLNQETIYTLNNEVVKSKGEAIIANFLLKNGIDYEYEKVYEELIEDKYSYKPDFTLDLAGEKVYIEYFGLSTYKDNDLKEYERIRKKKEKYHEEHHTKFIKIDYTPKEKLIETLKNELIKMGFILKPKTPKEIYIIILNSNPMAQLYQFKDFMIKTLETIKSSTKREIYKKVIDDYIKKQPLNEKEKAEDQFKYIKDFYEYYEQKLHDIEEYGFDFSDMIYYANKYLSLTHTTPNLKFEYLIIDEYQDISQERYDLTKNIVKQNNAKVVAVGDDWQSIYAFTGSKIEYIYNFNDYFKGAKLLKITKTYRNSQQLIDCSGDFIMKNENQIKKQLLSDKSESNPIKFVLFEKDEEYTKLKELILKIHRENPNHSILILARKNKMISKCYKDPELKDDIGTKIKFEGHEDIEIDGMTIHKSKGLTSDEVIVIGLDKEFPIKEPNCFWVQYLFKSKLERESIEYAEERRIFYVALTRTKNHVYLLVNKNSHYRSRFADEIAMIKKGNNEKSQNLIH